MKALTTFLRINGLRAVNVNPDFVQSLIKHQFLIRGPDFHVLSNECGDPRKHLYMKFFKHYGWRLYATRTCEFTSEDIEYIQNLFTDLNHKIERLNSALENAHVLKLDI